MSHNYHIEQPEPRTGVERAGDRLALLAAFAKRRPHARTVTMIARDPRGDYIALLCRLIGLGVVRGDSEEGGWDALLQLAHELTDGACVILTAGGGGPARIAKVGAVALVLDRRRAANTAGR